MNPYCTHAHGRQAGWALEPSTGLWVAACGLPSRMVWEATQESCEATGSNHSTPGMIDVDGKENEMKEIEMSEPLVSEDEVKAAVQAAFDEANTKVDEIMSEEPTAEPDLVEPLYVRIRTLRESLGLSRKQVQDATGLGASVVWRAEQEGKDIGAENNTKIWDFLIAVDGGAIEVEKMRKSRKAETPTGEAAQLIAEWTAKTWELRGVIDQAHEFAVAKRRAAQDAKKSTKCWDELITLLEPHITEK